MSFGFTAFAHSSGGAAVAGPTLIERLTSTPLPGVLNIQPGNITTDIGAGMKLAELECGWDSAASGQTQGTYDTTSGGYLWSRAQAALELKNAGCQVAVSAGIFNFPSWVDTIANWQYVDQFGNVSGTPNFIWNPAVRSAAATYISALTSVMAAAGVDVDYYRIGIAPSGEMNLPPLPAVDGVTQNSFWAFDATAQTTNVADLPSGVPVCPMPGWTPGSSSYSGGSVNATAAGNWWLWYMTAVSNAHQWEIDAHRAGGWAGAAMLCIPGLGASPAIITERVNNLLAASPADYSMNQAEAWHLAIQKLASPTNMVIDISSVFNGDGGTTTTGTSGANNYPTSTAADDALSLAVADFNVSHWSSARWISYLARKYGLECVGENPGDDPTGLYPYTQSLASQVAGCMTQAQACGLYGIMWAADGFMAQGNTSGHGYATPAQVVAGFNAAF